MRRIAGVKFAKHLVRTVRCNGVTMLTGKPVSEEGGTSSDGVDGLGSDRTSLSDLL